MKQPILSIADLEVLKLTSHRGWSTYVLDTTFLASDGAAGMAPKLQSLCEEADKASKNHEIIILSDRNACSSRVPISSLLALGA